MYYQITVTIRTCSNSINFNSIYIILHTHILFKWNHALSKKYKIIRNLYTITINLTESDSVKKQ